MNLKLSMYEKKQLFITILKLVFNLIKLKFYFNFLIYIF